MACWDILGKKTNLPLYTLLGGKQLDEVKLYKVVTRTEPDAMAARIPEYQALGYRNFQVKVGEDPLTDIKRIQKVAACMKPGEVLNADANTGWKQHQALFVADAIKDLPHQHGILVSVSYTHLTLPTICSV